MTQPTTPPAPTARPLRVLVGCEFSGIVRQAFRARGCEAWSCDLLPAEDVSPYHLQADLTYVLNYPRRVLGGHPLWMRERQWDLLIAHPPCTYLCNSGVRWLYGGKGTTPDPERWAEMEEAASFFGMLWAKRFSFRYVAIENPIMHRHARDLIFGKTVTGTQSQVIQPWQFGHPEIKATCLWLSDRLPKLQPTTVVEGRHARVHRASPGPDRWKDRSRTLPGIAAAMADQWGGLHV